MRANWQALTLLIVTGCSTLPDVSRRIELAEEKAAARAFTAERVESGPFTLQAIHKGLDGGYSTWHVYLEGDGQAFLTRTRLSPDPTPIDPIGLDLALSDPAPAVLYLGRPCQYRPTAAATRCPSRYWSSHRFADDVVAATLGAIETLADDHGADAIGLTLIGYSGGGALAALVASRMPMVERLVTVAAPLDLGAWSDHHDVSSLDGSIDPKTVASDLTMPQLHVSGGRDHIVPPATQDAFFARQPSSTPSRRLVLDAADHTCCWSRDWRALLPPSSTGEVPSNRPS